MTDRILIPNSVIGTVAEVLGGYYYSHSRLNTLFMEAGAPDDPPDGNCVTKCVSWLKRCNEDLTVKPLKVLGEVLQPFMDHDFSDTWGDKWRPQYERIQKSLAKNGLSYQLNGRILRSGVSPSSRTLAEMLRDGEFASVDAEFNRALAAVETDPPAGITAACSLLEALFKTYIDWKGLPTPSRQTIRELWRVVRDNLGLAAGSVSDEDLRKILSGLASIVEGVGAFRTHAGSAHGRGPMPPTITSRDARLAIHAAHTLAVYIMEVWHGHARLQGKA